MLGLELIHTVAELESLLDVLNSTHANSADDRSISKGEEIKK